MGFFEEKAQQVEPASVTAFGIQLSSRYGKAHELEEMLRFARLVAEARAEAYVHKVFYDTKSNCCSFELNPCVQEHDPVGQALRAAARQSIGQFDMFDYVDGKPWSEEVHGD